MMDNSLSFITALIGLILSIVVFGFLYRRKQKHSTIFSVIAFQSLGSKNSVAALHIGNEILVIGVMPNGLRVLKTLDAKEVLATTDEMQSDRLQKLRKLKEEVDE